MSFLYRFKDVMWLYQRTHGPVVALVADELTRACLCQEAQIVDVTPSNYERVLRKRRPDMLLVESAWNGFKNAWKYRIASYPDHPERNNGDLVRLVETARDLGVPTVFWNKEDDVHFDRFIDSARHFDHVFTVDANCVPRYRAVVPSSTTVQSMMFAVAPSLHGFSGFNFKHVRANFVGSYNRNAHDQRRSWQDLMFEHAAASLGLTLYDRNSGRKASNYRFPCMHNTEIRSAVAHNATARIYKDFLVSLNVNTVDQSPTMFSRRLVEILACGGIAVTNPSLSVDYWFKDYCHVVTGPDAARDLFDRLKYGPSADDLARARAGAEYVLKEHTWSHRLQELTQVLGLR